MDAAQLAHGISFSCLVAKQRLQVCARFVIVTEADPCHGAAVQPLDVGVIKQQRRVAGIDGAAVITHLAAARSDVEEAGNLQLLLERFLFRRLPTVIRLQHRIVHLRL